jgi:hypothetical protein
MDGGAGRALLTEFYQHRDPGKLATVEGILQRYTLAQIEAMLNQARLQERTSARQCLHEFYQHRDTGKLAQVDGIIAQYAGREYEVMTMLDQARLQEKTTARQCLHEFYQDRDPAKLAQIDGIMAQYAGREYEVITMIENAKLAEAASQNPQPTNNRGVVRRFSHNTSRRLSTEGKSMAFARDALTVEAAASVEDHGPATSEQAHSGVSGDSNRGIQRKFSANTSRRLSMEGRNLALDQDLELDELDLMIDLNVDGSDEEYDSEPPPAPALHKTVSSTSTGSGRSSAGSTGSGGGTVPPGLQKAAGSRRSSGGAGVEAWRGRSRRSVTSNESSNEGDHQRADHPEPRAHQESPGRSPKGTGKLFGTMRKSFSHEKVLKKEKVKPSPSVSSGRLLKGRSTSGLGGLFARGSPPRRRPEKQVQQAQQAQQAQPPTQQHEWMGEDANVVGSGEATEYRVVADNGVFVRAALSLDSPVVQRIPVGSIVHVAERNEMTNGVVRLRLVGEGGVEVGWTSANVLGDLGRVLVEEVTGADRTQLGASVLLVMRVCISRH